MFKKLFESGKWMILGVVLVMTACEESTELEESVVENYVEYSVAELQGEARAGRFGCVEFVFPVTIEFPDETQSEVESYEDLREAITTWKDANPDADERPKLALPLTVLTEDGEMIAIDTRSELRRLQRRCTIKRIRDRIRDRHRGDRCFKLVFPVNVAFPDGSTESFEDRQALRMGLREWKADNPDAEERPMLAFPVTVELEDGSTQEVGSQEELMELKARCAE